MAFETLTIDATVGGVALTAATYTNATHAEITVETAQARFTVDGTTVTASVGHLVGPGDAIELVTAAEISLFRAIRVSGTSATFQITYSPAVATTPAVGLNRFQIRRQVQGLLRDDTYPPEVINEALNRVLLDINNSGRFRFQQNSDTITLVDGTYKYAVTSSIIAEKLVVFQLGTSSEQVVVPKEADMLNAIANGDFLESGNAPTSYARWNDYWWFDPIPNATAAGKVVTVFTFKDITALTGDLDYPGIPPRYRGSVLVYGVAADIAPGLMVRTPQGNMGVQTAYEHALRKMMQQELWEPFSNKLLIRDPRWRDISTSGSVRTVR